MPEPTDGAPQICPARTEHLDNVLELLQENHLPVAGVETSFEDFFVARVGEEILGVVGIETADAAGMVRSLAVRRDARGRGIGGQLLHQAEEALRQRGISTAWLLTETAPAFFAARGYEQAERNDLPETLAARSALSGICPCSCTCMRKTLADNLVRVPG